MSKRTKQHPFTNWLRELDAIIASRVALDSTSLPLLDLQSAYRGGESPAQCFAHTVKPALEDLGFNIDLLDGLEEAAAEARQLRATFVNATLEPL